MSAISYPTTASAVECNLILKFNLLFVESALVWVIMNSMMSYDIMNRNHPTKLTITNYFLGVQ